MLIECHTLFHFQRCSLIVIFDSTANNGGISTSPQYGPIDPKERTADEHHLVILWSNLREFEVLQSSLDFARRSHPTDASPGLQAIFGEAPTRGFARVLGRKDELGELYTNTQDELEADAIGELFVSLQDELRSGSFGMALLPPSQSVEERNEWVAPAELIHHWFEVDIEIDEPLEVALTIEQLVAERDDPVAFSGALDRLLDRSSGLAIERGEYAQIEREVSFYERDYFTNALVLFLLGFLLVCFSWMLPTSRWLHLGQWLCVGLGTGLVLWGVTLRCIIRARPPISTLYETILFITGSILIVCMAIEWMNKKRIAIATATVLGAMGMFLAYKYEFKEAATAGDTMPALVAVLDTNFWLATHVTSVTLGYAAGLLAAALAHVWLLLRIFGLDGGDSQLRKSVANMVYGVICFGLLFSVVGTILGGVWANYSWGRFWGWDPKENGALMICLAELVIVHLRMGGYLRDLGVALASIVNGVVIAFSWWHVNHLGVGLHAYGFTDGIVNNLNIFYGVEAVIIAASGFWALGASSGGGGSTPTPA